MAMHASMDWHKSVELPFMYYIAMELDIVLCEAEISTRLMMAAGERPRRVARPDEITTEISIKRMFQEYKSRESQVRTGKSHSRKYIY